MDPTTDATTPSSGEASRARVSAIYRQDIAQSARMKGDDNRLWTTADSMIWSVNKRFRDGPRGPIRMFEWDIHDLWHVYYHAAINTTATSHKQDTLALQVIQAQKLGVLTRHGGGPQNQQPEEAVVSDGRIWVDLPFLVSDMTEYWLTGCARMSHAQRMNFTQFLANLASVRTANDGLCGIALVIFRDALETSRELGRSDDNDHDGEDPSRTLDELTVASLLPIVNTWLFTSGNRIIQLSEEGRGGYDSAVGRVGELALQQAEAGMFSEGFSAKRWLYWLQRLNEVKSDAAQKGEVDLAELCGRMSDNMLMTADGLGDSIHQSLKAAGGLVLHQQPVLLGSGPGGLLADQAVPDQGVLG